MVRRTLLAAALVSSVLLAAACGGSGDDKDSTTTTKPGPAFTSTTAAPKMPSSFTGGTKATYCKEWANLLTASGEMTTEGDATKTKYTKIVEIAERMLVAAPDEIKDDVQTAIRIAKDAAESGSLKPFDTDESKKVGSRIAAYNGQLCGNTTTTTAK